MTCDYDSGSMTGCRPLCDAPATHVVRFDGIAAHVCERHVRPTENRAWPYPTTVERLTH